MIYDLSSDRLQTLFQSNPHYKNYKQGRSKKIFYRNKDGVLLSGILRFPTDYKKDSLYPMIVRVYEKQGYKRFQYVNPTMYNGSGFNSKNYVNNGYFVFLPDISYTIGEPGFSAADCIISGTKAALKEASIDPDRIPDNYSELVKKNLNKNLNTAAIKFDNDILHRSKVIKHFLDSNEKISRTEKDFKAVYKKIKKNKKYFISIKDIVVLESLKFDGVTLPEDLDYSSLSSQLTVPKNLEDLANQKQTGLVMLKVIEIIGEDDVYDLDPETIYFLNRILNELNLKKIRNNILSEALAIKV